MKKPINTKLHGLLDYLFGLLLMLPWIVNYFEDRQDTWVLAIIGSFTVIISLLTDYELSLVKLLPMPVHLVLDVLTALTLIALPFIFPLYHYYLYWPVVLGIGELIIVCLSSSRAYVVTKNDLNITS